MTPGLNLHHTGAAAAALRQERPAPPALCLQGRAVGRLLHPGNEKMWWLQHGFCSGVPPAAHAGRQGWVSDGWRDRSMHASGTQIYELGHISKPKTTTHPLIHPPNQPRPSRSPRSGCTTRRGPWTTWPCKSGAPSSSRYLPVNIYTHQRQSCFSVYFGAHHTTGSRGFRLFSPGRRTCFLPTTTDAP